MWRAVIETGETTYYEDFTDPEQAQYFVTHEVAKCRSNGLVNATGYYARMS